MTVLSFSEFERIVTSALRKIQAEHQTLDDFRLAVRKNPRPLTAAEFYFLMAEECRHLYCRREKNYE